MEGYIKQKSDFKTLAMVQITAYSLTKQSIYDTNSSVTIVGTPAVRAGDFFYCDGCVFVIKETATEHGTTQITLESILSAFARPLRYAAPAAGTSIEQFIQTCFETQYATVSDEVYRMPYLDLHIKDTATPFLVPDVEDGLFSLKSYVSKVRRLKNVFVDFSLGQATLDIWIEQRTPSLHQIDFTETAQELLEENYSDDSIAKITAVTEGVATDYYRLADGSVTKTPGGNARATGKWSVIAIKNAADEETAVLDEFSKSSYSHSIVFKSTKQYGFFDRVVLRRNGRLLSSYLSSITVSSEDTRTLYKSGELRCSMTDKLRGNL